MEQQQLKNIIEAVLMSAEKPLKVNDIEALFAGDLDMPSRNEIRQALAQLAEDYQHRGFELKEVANGFRIQVGQDYAQWVGRLWEEKPARYSRALLETLALVAYRQPITRGEIEEIRGVSVSSNIIKTLQEREWIKVLGHKDVPGKPALYGTTKTFLDYFNLKSLEDLPTLAELRDLDQIHRELDLDVDSTADAEQPQPGDRQQDQRQPQDAAEGKTEAGSKATPEAVSAEPAAPQADDSDSESDTGQADDAAAESADAQADVAEATTPVAIVEDDVEASEDDDARQAEDAEKKPESGTNNDTEALENDMVEARPQRQSAAR